LPAIACSEANTKKRKQFASAISVGVLMLAVLVTGCSGEATDELLTDAQPVTITVGDSLSFEPVALNVQAGRPVLLTVKNVGNTDHDFTIVGMPASNVKNEIKGGHGHAALGAIVGHPNTKGEVTIRFTPTKSGMYEFYCSVTGHKQAGMVGMITVT
jgi:uncharacterized cupredoxin-like copper-binding protein